MANNVLSNFQEIKIETPVDKIIGFCFFAICSINGWSTISKEAILNAGTFNCDKKSALFSSNGELKAINGQNLTHMIVKSKASF